MVFAAAVIDQEKKPHSFHVIINSILQKPQKKMFLKGKRTSWI